MHKLEKMLEYEIYLKDNGSKILFAGILFLLLSYLIIFITPIEELNTRYLIFIDITKTLGFILIFLAGLFYITYIVLITKERKNDN